MRALIVYESMFGNTEIVAAAIAEGLGPYVSTTVTNVDDAPEHLDGFDLLVVGGPTHVHGMTRPSSRKAAEDQSTDAVRSSGGIREWLDALEPPPAGLQAAAFDTRLDKPRWLTGSAATSAGKALKRHHIKLVGPPVSFYVTGGTPPELTEGERRRASEWGNTLASEITTKA